MNYLGNAFSLNMVSAPCVLLVSDVDPGQVPRDAVSVVGHEETARVLSHIMCREVVADRRAVSLKAGDTIYVAALYSTDGKPYRAPEGKVLTADELGALTIRMKRVEVK